jgi:hypothetical protein
VRDLGFEYWQSREIMEIMRKSAGFVGGEL